MGWPYPYIAQKRRAIEEHFHDFSVLLHGLEKRLNSCHVSHLSLTSLFLLDRYDSPAYILQTAHREFLSLLDREVLVEFVYRSLKASAA
jgi:hypothetical protein